MIYAFCRNLADRPTFRSLPLCLLMALALAPAAAYARSAFSPRHSGIEPPGGPRPLETPMRSFGRTPDGGRGYTDAYGNRVDDSPPEEKKITRRRLERRESPAKESGRPLPDPASSAPLWKF